jgi:hypothetical protein
MCSPYAAVAECVYVGDKRDLGKERESGVWVGYEMMES